MLDRTKEKLLKLGRKNIVGTFSIILLGFCIVLVATKLAENPFVPLGIAVLLYFSIKKFIEWKNLSDDLLKDWVDFLPEYIHWAILTGALYASCNMIKDMSIKINSFIENYGNNTTTTEK